MLLQIRDLFDKFTPEEWSHMTAQIEFDGKEYRVGKVIPQGRFHINTGTEQLSEVD